MKAGLTLPMRLLRGGLGVAREEHAAFAIFGQADLDHLVDAPEAAGERGPENVGTPGRLVVSTNSTRASGPRPSISLGRFLTHAVVDATM